MTLPTQTPTTTVDIFADDVILNRYPVYQELRDLGGAVYIEPHGVWALGRYDDIRGASLDTETFSSARGVEMLEDLANMGTVGTILGSDAPKHDVLRAVLSEKLAPRALRGLRSFVQERADTIVAEAVAEGQFDAVTELAQRLPVAVVADLIGLPKEGRQVLLEGADAIFTAFGPMTPRLMECLPNVQAYLQYTRDMLDRDKLTPGSWGAAVLDAADEGRIDRDDAGPLMSAYMIAGMDTTVNSLGHFLNLLANRPDIWKALKDDKTLIPAAYEEILRMESPVQGFFRTTTRDVEIDGTLIPENSRVMLCYGSGNRDERHYADPDTYELKRNASDHLSFGYGTHGCAGQGLARMEAPAMVSALLRCVDHLEPTGEPVVNLSPVVCSLSSLPVAVTPL
jgi:cytochrome P450